MSRSSKSSMVPPSPLRGRIPPPTPPHKIPPPTPPRNLPPPTPMRSSRRQPPNRSGGVMPPPTDAVPDPGTGGQQHDAKQHHASTEAQEPDEEDESVVGAGSALTIWILWSNIEQLNYSGLYSKERLCINIFTNCTLSDILY